MFSGGCGSLLGKGSSGGQWVKVRVVSAGALQIGKRALGCGDERKGKDGGVSSFQHSGR